MKKQQIMAIGLSAMLFATSCRKTDVQPEAAPAPVATEAAIASGWKSVGNWNKQNESGYSVYSSTIEDAAITSDVASNGLVLVYKKGSAENLALPSEEGKSFFWYYQVSEGSLQIHADAYGSRQPGTNVSVQYFVLTADKLAQLDSDGYSKAELMKLTYENAKAIL